MWDDDVLFEGKSVYSLFIWGKLTTTATKKTCFKWLQILWQYFCTLLTKFDAIVHSLCNFLPHTNDKWVSMGRCTYCGLEKHPQLSYDWLASGSQDAYPPVPLSLVYRWLFKRRDSNMIFPTACHNSPPLLIHADSFNLHETKEKAAGPTKEFYFRDGDHSQTKRWDRFTACGSVVLNTSLIDHLYSYKKKRRQMVLCSFVSLCQHKYFHKLYLGCG